MLASPISSFGEGYLEFSIHLENGGDGSIFCYLETPAGVDKGMFRLPFGRAEAERGLTSASRVSQAYAARKGSYEGLDPLRDLGSQLYLALFEGSRSSLFRRAMEMAAEANKGLRMRLAAEDPDLVALPWEFLHDGRNFLALSGRTPLVRGQGRPDPVRPAVGAPLRLLAVLGEPGDVPLSNSASFDLSMDQVFHHLQERFSDIRMEVLPQATPEVIARAASGPDFQIFLLSSPGMGNVSGTPALRLGGGYGGDLVLQGQDLARLLKPQQNLRLVCLLGSDTSMVAPAIGREAPAVIGVRSSMSNPALQSFLDGMLAGILGGQPVEAAVTQGRQQIDLEAPGSREWGLPVLFSSAASGELFAFRPVHMQTKAAPPPTTESKASPEMQKLQLQLFIKRKNLETLETRKAAMANDAPADLLSQLNGLKDEIASLEEKLSGNM